MNNLRMWYIRNATKITWFAIGWMTLAGLEALLQGRYLDAGIDFALAGLNYVLSDHD